jgi:hypothetical protein
MVETLGDWQSNNVFVGYPLTVEKKVAMFWMLEMQRAFMYWKFWGGFH